jgi:hypothetical protein
MVKNKYDLLLFFCFNSIQKIIIIYIKKPFTICPKPNKHNILISREGLLRINKELLKNPFINCKFIKDKLNLIASIRTIRRYVNMLGWRRVETKYCQIVSICKYLFKIIIYS